MVDIDECAEKSPCDAVSMNCVNTKPSYRCDCKRGFEPKAGNASACQRTSFLYPIFSAKLEKPVSIGNTEF